MSETTYYADSTIRVNSEGIFLRDRMLQCDERKYTFDAIDSVEVHRYGSRRGIWRFIGVSMAGAILLLAILIGLPGVPDFMRSACWTAFCVATVASIGVFAYFLNTLFGGKRVDVYVVRLNGRFGYANIMASLDTEAALQVVNAIEAARQGRETPESFPSQITTDRLHSTYYYADPNVLVTRDELMIGDKSYPISQVKGASTISLTIDPRADVIDAINVLGALVYAVYILLSSIYDWRLSSGGFSPGYVWLGLYFGLTIAKSFLRRPYVYLLRLRLGFGKVTTAYASINQHYLTALAVIINAAHEDYEDAKQSARRASRWTI